MAVRDEWLAPLVAQISDQAERIGLGWLLCPSERKDRPSWPAGAKNPGRTAKVASTGRPGAESGGSPPTREGNVVGSGARRGRKLIGLVGRFVLTFAAAVVALRGMVDVLSGALHSRIAGNTVAAMVVIGVVAFGVACFVVWERRRH